MERIIEDYLNIDRNNKEPYNNGFGYGSSIGSGNMFGKGFCSIDYNIKENYNGSDITSYNGYKTYFINGYTLYIEHIREPWAIGRIIKNDLTTQKCYLGRINNHIVVGGSIREVIELLRESISKNKDNENDIAKTFVLAHPDYNKKYNWGEMLTWHALTYYSCADGRRKFSKLAGKTEDSMETPKELIKYMKNSISKRLAEKIEKLYNKENIE